jgi:hypothetical protein
MSPWRDLLVGWVGCKVLKIRAHINDQHITKMHIIVMIHFLQKEKRKEKKKKERRKKFSLY